MKHFIIIRFNYPKGYKFLAERIRLFKEYTLPSLRRQTNTNFHLLILGKPDIKIEGLEHTFLDWDETDKSHYVKSAVDFIRGVTQPDEIIITSRIDNDDMYLPNYVETVQNVTEYADEFNYKYPFLIEQKGYWWDQRVDKYYTNERYRANLTSPFLTLVEKGTCNTVYLVNHSKMGRRFPVIITKKYGWIQIIHKTNQLMNKIPIGELEGKEVKEGIINV